MRCTIGVAGLLRAGMGSASQEAAQRMEAPASVWGVHVAVRSQGIPRVPEYCGSGVPQRSGAAGELQAVASSKQTFRAFGADSCDGLDAPNAVMRLRS